MAAARDFSDVGGEGHPASGWRRCMKAGASNAAGLCLRLSGRGSSIGSLQVRVGG